jgi:tetratricopeptide (TPR) repeat protein
MQKGSLPPIHPRISPKIPNPTHRFCYRASIGNLLSAKHDLAVANEHYAASLAAGRIDGWPELNTAINLNDLGDLDNAEKWFRQALARRSTVRTKTELARYLNEFAWFLATKRSGDVSKLKEALGLSEESNDLLGHRNPNYLDTLAECQDRLGNTAEAVKTAEEALVLVVNNPTERLKYTERLAYFRDKLPK